VQQGHLTRQSKVDAAVVHLLRSKKFHRWELHPALLKARVNLELAIEKHFSPTELAKAWGVSTETIRSIFRTEPGVLKIGKPGTKYRRGYFTLRIPEQVAERVHRRLSA
jgi:hypothetical protein